MIQIKFNTLNADLVRSAPADVHQLSVIERLVKGADISAYLSNPAYSDSRFLTVDDDGKSDANADDLDGIIVWNLPGHGLPSPSDGWVRKAFACEGGDYVKPVKQSCGRLSCPNCCYDKMTEISENATEKILCARKNARELGRSGWNYLQHVVISPPKSAYADFTTDEGFSLMRKMVRDICAEIGLQGGAIVFHPFREDGVNGELVPDDYVPDESNSMDKSKWRFSPHFHVVGFGFIKPSTSDFVHSHHGWIYSALRTGKRKMRTSSDVRAVLRYVMTHAGIKTHSSKRAMSIVYFGLCNSQNQTILGEVVISRVHKCPHCGGIVHLVGLGKDAVHDCGIHLKARKYQIFGHRGFNLDGMTVFDILQCPRLFSMLTVHDFQFMIDTDPNIILASFRPKNQPKPKNRKASAGADSSAPRANARADLNAHAPILTFCEV